MNKALSSIYQHIAPAHRAIWRFGILLWPGFFWKYALASGSYKPESFFSFVVVVYLGLELANIIHEYQRPRPDKLGVSQSSKEFIKSLIWIHGSFTIVCLVIQRDHLLTSLPWLALIWLVAVGAYFLRPKPITDSPKFAIA